MGIITKSHAKRIQNVPLFVIANYIKLKGKSDVCGEIDAK